MKFTRSLGAVLGAGALVMSAACSQDLSVQDKQAPDVTRALGTPADVQNLAISSANSWYLTSATIDPWVMLDVTGDILTMNYGNFGARFNNLQPRIPYANDPANNDFEVAQYPWSGGNSAPGFYPTIGAANNVLKAVAGGMVLPGGTDQYKALAQWSQAGSLMQLALMYDKAFIVDETYDPATSAPLALAKYTDVAKAAQAKLDAVIAATTGKGWTYAASDFSLEGGPLTSDLIAKVANTQAAMLLAYTPRTSAEAATVNWTQVLAYANKGITSDFVIKGDGGNNWYSQLVDYEDLPGWMAIDQRLVHRMVPCVDSMYNGVDEPPNCPHDARVAADPNGTDPNTYIVNPTGTDIVYTPHVQGDPGRGIFMQSPYYHERYLNVSYQQDDANDGPLPYILKAENDLLKAEALVRTHGDKALAASLINNTHVTRGQLTPILATDADKTMLDAITYEREVELLATNGYSFYYARHDDQLQDGTLHHLPVPAKELETDGLAVYTFGGVGKPVMNVLSGPAKLSALHSLSSGRTADLALPNGTVMQLEIPARHGAPVRPNGRR